MPSRPSSARKVFSTMEKRVIRHWTLSTSFELCLRCKTIGPMNCFAAANICPVVTLEGPWSWRTVLYSVTTRKAVVQVNLGKIPSTMLEHHVGDLAQFGRADEARLSECRAARGTLPTCKARTLITRNWHDSATPSDFAIRCPATVILEEVF